MPIPLGVLAVAGAGGGGPTGTNVYELLETNILGSSQSSITFSNLNTNYGSTYKHLQIRMAVFNESWAAIRMNGVTTNGAYTYHELRGNGSSVSSSANAGGQTLLLVGLGQSSTGPTAIITDLLDAFSTSKNKTIRSLHGTTSGGNVVGLTSGAWLSTNVLTSIEIRGFTANFQTGSRFSLYGMRSS
jgi:hypothetical protein